jgi:hypothetical protein
MLKSQESAQPLILKVRVLSSKKSPESVENVTSEKISFV